MTAGISKHGQSWQRFILSWVLSIVLFLGEHYYYYIIINMCLLSLYEAATDKLVKKIVKHDSWPIQPDILNPPLLRLTSRKPLWLDLQPVDIKSRWRHNWKSAQVVTGQFSSSVRPHNPATGFRPPSATVVSAKPFLHGTGTLQCL